MAFLDDFVNIVTNSFDPANLFGFGHGNSASSRGTNSGSILGDTWDKFMNGNSNDVNWRIAQDNLAYQRERNEIEDARYAEETAYNRSWAEEERDYNRALQQQLFEREDTAQIRQAEQLSKLGINPLSQQLNGAGAGAQVSSATPASASSRGGTALHNDFNQIPGGVVGALAPLASLANTINQVATGEGQRDLLRAQADKQKLDNYILANQWGLTPEFMRGYKDFKASNGNMNNWFNMNAVNQFNKNRLDNQTWFMNDLKKQDFQREFNFRKSSGYFSSAPDIANKFNYFMSDSFFETAEKALTKGSELFDKAFNKDTQNTHKINPFQMFMNLFF